jgi:dephospho-CoA kinase
VSASRARATARGLRVAITGGAGSGKSLAAECFRARGVPVFDADAIARELVRPGEPGFEALNQALGQAHGEGIFAGDGSLDRRRLRERMLASETLRRQVEGLLHPLILERLEAAMAASPGPYAVAEIPLLAETGLAERFDEVVLIDCPRPERVRRIMRRDGVSQASARALIDAQAGDGDRRRIATRVVDNSGDRQALEAQIDALHEALLNRVKAGQQGPG